ncbi:MAG: single-stranded DNA-binding protein, partial [Chitinophagaceae bacterium]
GNIAVSKFSLATTESFKDKNGKQISQTEWHTVVLWRGLAELSQKYLHKGSLVYIEGRLRTRTWEDKDHNKKHATEIVGDNLVMLDKRSDLNPSDNFSEDYREHEIPHTESSHEGHGSSPESKENPAGGKTTEKQANDDLPF